MEHEIKGALVSTVASLLSRLLQLKDMKIWEFIIWFSGDIILFPVEYNSILISTEINVPEIPKMNADNK